MDEKNQLVSDIVRDVCELPDYNSPEDNPDSIQCTVQELSTILSNRLVYLVTPEKAAQIRDLLRCITWIRDLQLISDPNTFDNGELFRDINRKYLADQLLTATKLYAQLDDYCQANHIPTHPWKME